MVETPSTMLPLGTAAPTFRLPDAVSGRTVSLEDFTPKSALLVMFICNHCPYVIHIRDELVLEAHPDPDKPCILLRREGEPEAVRVYLNEVRYLADALCSMAADMAGMIAGDTKLE